MSIKIIDNMWVTKLIYQLHNRIHEEKKKDMFFRNGEKRIK